MRYTASLTRKVSDPRRNVCPTSRTHGGCAGSPVNSAVTGQASQELSIDLTSDKKYGLVYETASYTNASVGVLTVSADTANNPLLPLKNTISDLIVAFRYTLAEPV